MLAVVEAVVEKAGWTPGVGSTGQGVGVAVSFNSGSYVAEVAKVEVDTTTGQIRVLHVDVVFDCGLVVKPFLPPQTEKCPAAPNQHPVPDLPYGRRQTTDV